MIIEQTFISEDGIYGFNREIVEQYLAIVDDENPIHEYIVPGQLIVEKVFSMMDVDGLAIKSSMFKPLISMKQ